MSGLKWTRRTTRKVARKLKSMGIPVSASTVGRLLKQMGYWFETTTRTANGLQTRTSAASPSQNTGHSLNGTTP
ncbi:MAG: hypothetical protein HY360_26320 [Verrucomicrobia bacterium]|nr:hypothetical protein [Verrucomicrobiota bacterium]